MDASTSTWQESGAKLPSYRKNYTDPSWHPEGPIQEDATGSYQLRSDTGAKSYLSPRALDGYDESPLPYDSGLLGGGSVWNSEKAQFDKKSKALEYAVLGGAMAPFAAAAIPALGSLGGPSGIMTGPVESTLAATPGAQAGFSLTPGVTAAAGGGGSHMAGGIGGWLKGMGIDPTMLGLGGLSLLGGDDGQELQSYDGTAADPVNALADALNMARNLSTHLASRGPTKLRSSFVPPAPVGVNVPGLPFQIGGGLGQDPALRDQSLLESPNSMQGLDLFAPAGSQAGGGKAVSRRKPNGSTS